MAPPASGSDLMLTFHHYAIRHRVEWHTRGFGTACIRISQIPMVVRGAPVLAAISIQPFGWYVLLKAQREFYWYVSENDNCLALRCYTKLRGDLGSEVLLEDHRSLLWQYLKP